jgi:2-dehydro-3-deoxyphosphogluconate aldolase/(4S)-4-hydroxy-2-oxoglutarate aldolase
MLSKDVFTTLMNEKLVAIFRGVPLDEVGPVSTALAEAGIKFIELTYNQCSENPKEDFAAQMKEARDAVGDKVYIGAGTVLSVEQVDWAHEVGAEYIVSPITKGDVIKRTKELGLMSIPGANTPTEIVYAYECGADMVKLYIIDEVKQVKYLMGPIGHIPMQATCGVTLDSIPEFMKAGIKAFGTRAFLTDDLIHKKDYAGMKDLAKKYIEQVKKN